MLTTPDTFSAPALTPLQRAVKRTEDIICAVVLGAVFLPVACVIAIAVCLDSPGPILFRQLRLGLGAKPFPIYKFRSMYVDCDSAIHKEFVSSLIAGKEIGVSGVNKLVADPRITRVGRVIRKYSLDEVPQLANVLVGNMSLVGPRPPLPYEYDQYTKYQKKRLSVKPGLTGLWQTSGKYRLSFSEMIDLDIKYITNWSLWLDLRIIAKTVGEVLGGRSV